MKKVLTLLSLISLTLATACVSYAATKPTARQIRKAEAQVVHEAVPFKYAAHYKYRVKGRDFFYPYKLNSEELIVEARYRKSLKEPSEIEYYSYNIKTNELKKIENDNVINKSEIFHYFADNKLIVQFKPDEKKERKLALYDYKTKKLKYFSNNYKEGWLYRAIPVDNKKTIMLFRESMAANLCDMTTMVCSDIPGRDVLSLYGYSLFHLDDNRILAANRRSDDELTLNLFDPKTMKNKPLGILKHNPKSSLEMPVQYKKNHFCYIDDLTGEKLEIVLFKIENDEIQTIGRYRIKRIPKYLLSPRLIPISEDKILFYIGLRLYVTLPERILLHREDEEYSIIFNAETKTYNYTCPLPMPVCVDRIIPMNDEDVVLYTKRTIILLNKKEMEKYENETREQLEQLIK